MPAFRRRLHIRSRAGNRAGTSTQRRISGYTRCQAELRARRVVAAPGRENGPDMTTSATQPDIYAALGIPRHDWPQMTRWADAPRNPHVRDALDTYIDVMIADRCRRIGDDLLSSVDPARTGRHRTGCRRAPWRCRGAARPFVVDHRHG